MAEEKKTAPKKARASKKTDAAKEEKLPLNKEEAPKASKKKASKKEEAKVETKSFPAPNSHDYEVILEPVITEKSMALLQNGNKVTVKVSDNANKTEIKESFQRLYGVKVTDVKIINVLPKAKSRGGRYKGKISGYKKAFVSVAEGNAVDLFKE